MEYKSTGEIYGHLSGSGHFPLSCFEVPRVRDKTDPNASGCNTEFQGFKIRHIQMHAVGSSKGPREDRPKCMWLEYQGLSPQRTFHFIWMRETDNKIKILDPVGEGSLGYRNLTPYRVVKLTLTLSWFTLVLSSGQRSGR